MTGTTTTLKSMQKPELPDYEARKVVNLYSESELVRNLADYISDVLLSMGNIEDYTFTNIRIVLTGICCLLALYATVGVGFPDGVTQLKITVASFFTVLLVLFAIEATTVKSAIIAIRTPNRERLFLDGRLDRTDGQFVLGIRRNNEGIELSNSLYIGLLFDVDGMMQTDAVFKLVHKLMLDFESGKRDDKKQK
eukprot:GHVS01028891.1.p1 GENE.GHVS01028891.1~~GHVS01028891.1.p1  ORF type:complete len:194 (+),score=21.40 GHVS01028891.1:232-813(+)